jgi:hypothetical protein
MIRGDFDKIIEIRRMKMVKFKLLFILIMFWFMMLYNLYWTLHVTDRDK